jgi:cephalosporin hydroxylase
LKILIDTDAETVTCEDGGESRTTGLYSSRTFELLSEQWLRVGWARRYSYAFTWLGRPVIQLPEDLVRVQELIYGVSPDVIIETGVAHGGGLAFYASMCRLLGKGRVIGVDVEIRPNNRAAIESHPLSEYITLIEGDSVEAGVVAKVGVLLRPGETVLVVLDSKHTKAHVLSELEAYAPMVTLGSYAVATDGVMEELAGVPCSGTDWSWDNPKAAAAEFVRRNPGYVIEEPQPLFDESLSPQRITYWKGGYVKRVR